MSSVDIDVTGNSIRLSGNLDFATVPSAVADLRGLITPGADLSLSLAGVGRANSAGLVLLLEIREAAESAGATLRFVDLPESLVNLASMCNLEPILQD